MENKPTLMTFPCDFQIKIIGEHHDSFALEIIDIARQHFPTLQDSAIQKRPSQQGNYLALSITVHALDQTSLDALYRALTQHPSTKMVL